MLKPNSIVDAAIKRIEPHGLFLAHDDTRHYVDGIEVAWPPDRWQPHRFSIDQRVRVRIMSYSDTTNLYYGSIRRVDPASNPYRELDFANVNKARLTAKIWSLGEHYLFVQLQGGQIGSIDFTNGPGAYSVGDVVDVRIAKLDIENGELELKLVSKHDD